MANAAPRNHINDENAIHEYEGTGNPYLEASERDIAFGILRLTESKPLSMERGERKSLLHEMHDLKLGRVQVTVRPNKAIPEVRQKNTSYWDKPEKAPKLNGGVPGEDVTDEPKSGS
jgi:hypothetical protein